MQHEMHVLGIDIAQRVLHLVGMDDRGKIVSLNLSLFVANSRMVSDGGIATIRGCRRADTVLSQQSA